MSQLTLFPTPPSRVNKKSIGRLSDRKLNRIQRAVSMINGDTYWALAEESGSALRSFYMNRQHADYTLFAQSCQKFAEYGGYSFVDASRRIHNMFNIKPFGK
jgi:hypothetical protein